MAKTILGVDIGYESLKLALCQNGVPRKLASAPMPQHLIREGRLASTDTAGEIIRNALRENGIRASHAAVILSDEVAFVRNVSMPKMGADQLALNLPYEFGDYISDELRKYAFDYAMITPAAQLKAGEDTMELMATAAPFEYLDELRETMRKAGLKLVKAAPVASTYIGLIRRLAQGASREYCIVDLGYRAIRIHMFHGDRFDTTREIESGMQLLDQVVADAFNVDVHLAHAYLNANFNGCQNSTVCLAAYDSMAVEITRVLNFYRFSNPDSTLSDIWLVGGGAAINPLRLAIEQSVDMNVHPANDLITGAQVANAHTYAQAIGITVD